MLDCVNYDIILFGGLFMPEKKQQVLNAEERFFLNLNEELTIDIEYQNFVFTLEVPTLMSEASLSLSTLKAAQALLSQPEYGELVSSLAIPRLIPKPKSEENDSKNNGNEELTVKEESLDLKKISHVRYALRNLPEEVVTNLNNIAYLQLAVKEIRYMGKEFWVQVDGEDIKIDTFNKFFIYVKSKKIRLGTLLDYLLTKYADWLEELEITPQEVKN